MSLSSRRQPVLQACIVNLCNGDNGEGCALPGSTELETEAFCVQVCLVCATHRRIRLDWADSISAGARCSASQIDRSRAHICVILC